MSSTEIITNATSIQTDRGMRLTLLTVWLPKPLRSRESQSVDRFAAALWSGLPNAPPLGIVGRRPADAGAGMSTATGDECWIKRSRLEIHQFCDILSVHHQYAYISGSILKNQASLQTFIDQLSPGSPRMPELAQADSVTVLAHEDADGEALRLSFSPEWLWAVEASVGLAADETAMRLVQ
jgi:hypothetical protein